MNNNGATAVKALDQWAGMVRGRSWETGYRKDSDAWVATAWENGREVDVSHIANSPSEARVSLVAILTSGESR